jgi:hypothetical protein
MEFITGMYWFARSPDTLRIRMREVDGMRTVCVVSESASADSAVASREESTKEWRSVDFAM